MQKNVTAFCNYYIIVKDCIHYHVFNDNLNYVSPEDGIMPKQIEMEFLWLCICTQFTCCW